MSIHIQSRAWIVKGLKMPEKVVLVKLADNANDEGRCWPSIARIAEECSCSKSTVIRAIKTLMHKGHLEATRGRGSNTRYLVKPVLRSIKSESDKVNEEVYSTSDSESTVSDAHQCQRDTSVRETPVSERHLGGCQRDTSLVSERHPNRKEPSIEPSIIPPKPPKGGSKSKKKEKGKKASESFDELPVLRQRLTCCFRKKPRMPRPPQEDVAWGRIEGRVCEEDVALVEKFYRAPKSEEYNPTWNRKSELVTLFRNWEQQVEFAERWMEIVTGAEEVPGEVPWLPGHEPGAFHPEGDDDEDEDDIPWGPGMAPDEVGSEKGDSKKGGEV